MKQEILDLIQLNTYIDYSANKATDEDINALVSRRTMMKHDKGYLDFLRQLNGFKIYDLNIFGTKRQDDLDVGEVWYYNDYYSEGNPNLREYFIIGDCSDAFYAYQPEQKQYCSLELPGKGASGGRAFGNLDELLDWAVNRSAKRFNEQTTIIHKKALLHLANQISSFLEAHGFQTKNGNILLNLGYQYVRSTLRASERLGISLQTNTLRNKLSLSFSLFKRYNLIETFFETDYMKKARIRDNRSITVMLYEDLPAYQSEFSEQELNGNYEAITARIIAFIETHIFRAFTLYDNVSVLDSKVNESLDGVGNLEKGKVAFYQKMIIAKLAGNPRYDAIFKSAKEGFEKGSREFLNLTLSLNDDLQKIPPMTNGMLV